MERTFIVHVHRYTSMLFQSFFGPQGKIPIRKDKCCCSRSHTAQRPRVAHTWHWKNAIRCCDEVTRRKCCSLGSVCRTSWLQKLSSIHVNPLAVHLPGLVCKKINSLMLSSLYWPGRMNVNSAKRLENSCACLAFTALGIDCDQQRAKQDILGKHFNCLNRWKQVQQKVKQRWKIIVTTRVHSWCMFCSQWS